MSLVGELLSFTRFVARRVWQDRCSQVAASLTYTTLLALVPMITIALTMMSAFPVFEELMGQARQFVLDNLVPDAAGKVITGYMEQFSQNAAGLTALGIAFLAVTALLLMFTIDSAFNAIWRTSRPRPLLHRFVIYWAMLTLGPLLVGASISLTSYLVGLSEGLVEAVPAVSPLLLRIVPIALTTIAFFLLYLTVPNRFVPRWHAFIGALIAALVFELTKRVFALYVARVPTYSLVYGAFASFPLFLLWVYCSWLVILLGAVITAALPYWRGRLWRVKATPGQRFYDALRILRVLHRARQDGKTVNLRTLRLSVPIALENLEELLERLTDDGFVRRGRRGEYAMADRPESIRLAQLYRLFVFDTDLGRQGLAADEALTALTTKIDEGVAEDLDLTLEAVFAAPRHDAARSQPEVKRNSS
ncbi:MAG: YihY family inner membrane protein [Burkholderiales bacterium]|nr:YihY family inner membrane protein [Burkholderiales bacterium]